MPKRPTRSEPASPTKRPPPTDSVQLDGQCVPFRVEVRPRRQRAAIQIARDGQVAVLLPPGVPRSYAAELLHSKSAWVLSHLRDLPAPTRLILGEGTRLALWGGPITIRVIDHAFSRTTYHPETRQLYLWIPPILGHADREARVRDQLRSWYSQELSVAADAAVSEWLPRVGGPRPRRLIIGDYRSRWGACRPDGTITLNWRLAAAPAPCLTYVVVHELTHLIHRNHSQKFWHAVERVLPSYPDPRQWLAQHGHELFW